MGTAARNEAASHRIAIRRAILSDAPLLAELGSQAFYEAFARDTPERDMAAYLADSFTPDKLAAQIVDQLSLFIIAESVGEAIGYACLYPTNPPGCVNGPDPIQLVRFYLLKEWYGCGVGSSLMKACLSETRRRGYQTIWLSSWEINLRANSFYRKWKFEPVGTQDFLVGNDIQHDVILMRTI
jgi:ribosomal protein S18 acetylase RimI-like enzyme